MQTAVGLGDGSTISGALSGEESDADSSEGTASGDAKAVAVGGNVIGEGPIGGWAVAVGVAVGSGDDGNTS